MFYPSLSNHVSNSSPSLYFLLLRVLYFIFWSIFSITFLFVHFSLLLTLNKPCFFISTSLFFGLFDQFFYFHFNQNCYLIIICVYNVSPLKRTCFMNPFLLLYEYLYCFMVILIYLNLFLFISQISSSYICLLLVFYSSYFKTYFTSYLSYSIISYVIISFGWV